MVRLLLDQERLEIGLSALERLLALRRSSIRVPRSSIVRLQLTSNPWTRLRGIRSPGTHIPGAVAAGRWRSTRGDDFVLVRGRRLDGVVLVLDEDQEFQRIILSTAHGRALIDALRLDDVAGKADVVDLVDP
ncbi:MAG: hypothetical protein ACTHZX_04990 [Microbacterium sp.]